MTRSRAARLARRLEAARLLGQRVSYTDTVRTLAPKHGVSERTIKNDIAAVYKEWTASTKEQQGGNLTLSIDSCLREIRRCKHALAGKPDSEGRRTCVIIPQDEFRYSMALLKWESHLARLQGTLIGRVDVTSDGEPMRVVMNIPTGPYEEDND